MDRTHFPEPQCVVVLHGLMRTSGSMRKVAQALEQNGYSVINVDYPSRKKYIEELAPLAVEKGLSACRALGAKTIHFVTHSLGGILLRYYLSKNKIPELGRVVMLAPPNHGSETVDLFEGMPGFGLAGGPAGRQLGTKRRSVPMRLGPADFEVGIIAGSWSINFSMGGILPTPNDGTVSVESARLEGMKDFIVVRHTHSFIMRSDRVIRQTIYFLQNGIFNENG